MNLEILETMFIAVKPFLVLALGLAIVRFILDLMPKHCPYCGAKLIKIAGIYICTCKEFEEREISK